MDIESRALDSAFKEVKSRIGKADLVCTVQESFNCKFVQATSQRHGVSRFQSQETSRRDFNLIFSNPFQIYDVLCVLCYHSLAPCGGVVERRAVPPEEIHVGKGERRSNHERNRKLT